MNDEISNLCSHPYKHYELLKKDDEKTWYVVKKTFHPVLTEDITVSVKKQRRKYELSQIVTDSDLPALVFSIGEESWERFRQILTDHNSKFIFEGVNKAYNYLRVISKNIIHDRVRNYLKIKEEIQKQYSFEELNENNGLDNFLFINGGFNDENPEDVYIRKEQMSIFVQCMEQLSENQQLILAYRYFDEMSSAQIAEKLNMTEASVNTTLTRIRTLLRHSLKRRDYR